MKTDLLDSSALAKYFKILSDPTRLKLFSILLRGVHCNCELSSLTGFSNNLISHHMHVLVDAGLVVAKRKPDDARWILYAINLEWLELFQNDLAVFLKPVPMPEREPVCPPCKKNDRERKNE